MYDPALGRWHAVDPMAEEEQNLSFSPYNYCINNPILYLDPNGEDWYVHGESGNLQWYNGTYEDDALPEGYNRLGDDYFFGEEALIQASCLDAVTFNEETGEVETSNVVNYEGDKAIDFADSYGFKKVPTERVIEDKATIATQTTVSNTGPAVKGEARTYRNWKANSVTYTENSATPVLIDTKGGKTVVNGIFQTTTRVNTYRWSKTNVVASWWRKKSFILPSNPYEKIVHESPYKKGDGNLSKKVK